MVQRTESFLDHLVLLKLANPPMHHGLRQWLLPRAIHSSLPSLEPGGPQQRPMHVAAQAKHENSAQTQQHRRAMDSVGSFAYPGSLPLQPSQIQAQISQGSVRLLHVVNVSRGRQGSTCEVHRSR